MEILGVPVLAQIDTGFQDKFNQNFVDINKPLIDLLASKLPAVNNYGNYYVGKDGLTYVETKESTKKIATVDNVYLRPKAPGSGGIVDWNIPAAMISAPAFFNAFNSSEFRADTKSVWVKKR